jgi:hypothetical protein
MITFKEFQYKSNLILERYYEPNEKHLGRPAVQKAESKGIKGPLLDKVKRGADNKTWDTSPHPDILAIPGHPTVSYIHKPTGTTFSINTNLNKVKSGKLKGKTVHEVGFNVPRGSNDTLKTRVRKLNDVKKIWRDHIAPRAPHGSIIQSRTKYNESNKSRGRTGKDRRNTRALKYEEEGMGSLKHGVQFGLVGRNPSPRQKIKGKSRISPVSTLSSRNLETPPIRGFDYG